jgi:hypothetical protein
MALFGRDRGRIETDLTQALSHPVRLGILALFTTDTLRSLAAEDLLSDLIEVDRDRFDRYSAGQILYHRARLQDVHLIPAS